MRKKDNMKNLINKVMYHIAANRASKGDWSLSIKWFGIHPEEFYDCIFDCDNCAHQSANCTIRS